MNVISTEKLNSYEKPCDLNFIPVYAKIRELRKNLILAKL